MISTLEIHFLFFKNEFREGTYTPLWGVSMIALKVAQIRRQFHIGVGCWHPVVLTRILLSQNLSYSP
jgi:hypothetical protein